MGMAHRTGGAPWRKVGHPPVIGIWAWHRIRRYFSIEMRYLTARAW